MEPKQELHCKVQVDPIRPRFQGSGGRRAEFRAFLRVQGLRGWFQHICVIFMVPNTDYNPKILCSVVLIILL